MKSDVNLFRRSNFIVIFTFLLIFLGGPLFSWWTQIHPKLSQLSFDHYSQVLHNTQLNSYYFDFVNAAIDPDEHKSLTHGRAWQRAQNAFNAAVNAYSDGIYRDAAMHLGHSFHYLQDLGDPSKEVDDWTHKERGNHTRDLALNILENEYLRDNSVWQENLSYEMQYVSSLDFPGILSRLDTFRKNKGTEMRGVFETFRTYRNFDLDKELRNGILTSFMTVAACQNRVIDLFAERIAFVKPEEKAYLVVWFQARGWKFVYFRDDPGTKDVNAQMDDYYLKRLITFAGYNTLSRQGIHVSNDDIRIHGYQLLNSYYETADLHCGKEREGYRAWISSTCR